MTRSETAEASNLKLMPVFYSEIHVDVKNCTKPPLLVLCICNNKAWLTAHLFPTWFADYFKPTFHSSESNIFQSIAAYCNASGHVRAVMKIYNINGIFMSVSMISIQQSKDYRVILIFKSYYIRNLFCKATAMF